MITAIVQARMGSTRLPGKVLRAVLGRPLLLHLVDRLRYSSCIARIVVATSTETRDDAIHSLVADEGIDCFRGSERDVLGRYYQAATWAQADPIVRITADCPLIDPVVTDTIVRRYLAGDADFVSNQCPFTYPNGLDTAVFSFAALEATSREARSPFEREHVVPFILANPSRFRLASVEHSENLFARYRWCLDYEEDYVFIRSVFEALYPKKRLFLMDDVLRLLRERPELSTINRMHLEDVPMEQLAVNPTLR